MTTPKNEPEKIERRPADAVRIARRGITDLSGDKMLQQIVERRGLPIAP